MNQSVQLACEHQPKVDKRELGYSQIHVSFVSKQVKLSLSLFRLLNLKRTD